MPLYDYAPVSGLCKQCSGRFEVVQRISEEKLTHCPTCNQPVERLISAPALGGKYAVNDAKIKQLGLTKYRNTGEGVYERTVGSGGPETIDRSRK